MATASSLAADGRRTLEVAAVPEPLRDAEVLLAHVLCVDRSRLHAHPEMPIEPAAADKYRWLVDRRAAREPLQYLTGTQEFWSLSFEVSPLVLIPRPETEGVVEAFLRLNGDRPDPVVLDIGTGSGCLAVVVAREVADARIFATDISPDALRVARRNAAAHGVAERVDFRSGDLFEPLRGAGLESSFDFLLANPPYLGEVEIPGLMPEVRDHEPRAALVAGEDGLLVQRRLAREAADFLKPGGYLIAEIGLGQEVSVRELYRSHPRLAHVAIEPDLAGIPRILIVQAR